MSATVAFHPRGWAGTFRRILEYRSFCQREKQRSGEMLRPLRRANRAKYDPQSGHNPECPEQRTAQAVVSLEADRTAGLSGTKGLGEEFPGNVRIHGHMDGRRWGCAGEQLPLAPTSRQCPDAASISSDLELHGSSGPGLDRAIGEGQGPDEDV